MTKHPAAPRSRPRSLTPSVIAAGVAVALVVGPVGPASAAAPDQWAEVEPVSALSFLVLLVLIPGGLFLLITLLSSIGGMARGETAYRPGLAWRHEPEWFGGPRDGLDKVDENRQVEAGADAPERGGASGRW